MGNNIQQKNLQKLIFVNNIKVEILTFGKYNGIIKKIKIIVLFLFFCYNTCKGKDFMTVNSISTEQTTTRKRKTLEELTIQDDYLFKRVMSEKDICLKFVQIILGIDIKDIVYIKAEEVVKELYDSKGIRLDVYLKDEDEVVYNIEMQVASLGEEEFAKRFRYYEAMIDSYLLRVGQKYKDLNKLFIVFICPFKIFKSERTIYTFKNFCVEDKSIELKDDVTKIFITTKSPNKENLSEDFLALLKYIDGNITDNPFVNEIESKIHEIKQDEKERGAYMQYDLHLMQIEEEARKEGFTEALLETAKNLLKLGIPNDKIAEATKLDIEEIKSLSAQMAASMA